MILFTFLNFEKISYEVLKSIFELWNEFNLKLWNKIGFLLKRIGNVSRVKVLSESYQFLRLCGRRSPTGNLTNGRLITIICRGGFRVYFHICEKKSTSNNAALSFPPSPPPFSLDFRWLVLISSHPSSNCQNSYAS